MSSDLERLIEEDVIIAEFECPICRYYMHPPILQCKVGHSFCNNCYSKVPSCPTCKGQLSECTRNWSLENIHEKLQFPCIYEDSGCKTIVPGMNIISHELLCKFRTMECPLRTTGIDFCNWEGSIFSSVEHCQSHHPEFFFTTPKQEFFLEEFVRQPCCFYSYFYVHEEFFIYTWTIDYSSGVIKWCVFRIDTGSETTFDYEIEILKDPTSTDRFYLRSRCPVVLHDKVSIDRSEFLVGHYDVIKNYCDDGSLKYSVTIRKK